jgi:hypothetical protein
MKAALMSVVDEIGMHHNHNKEARNEEGKREGRSCSLLFPKHQNLFIKHTAISFSHSNVPKSLIFSSKDLQGLCQFYIQKRNILLVVVFKSFVSTKELLLPNKQQENQLEKTKCT